MAKTNEIDAEIGSNIELHRKLRRKTRAWLGLKIGRSYNQVQNYENARYRVASSVLYAIATALEYPINKFFPDKNEK